MVPGKTHTEIQTVVGYVSYGLDFNMVPSWTSKSTTWDASNISEFAPENKPNPKTTESSPDHDFSKVLAVSFRECNTIWTGLDFAIQNFWCFTNLPSRVESSVFLSAVLIGKFLTNLSNSEKISFGNMNPPPQKKKKTHTLSSQVCPKNVVTELATWRINGSNQRGFGFQTRMPSLFNPQRWRLTTKSNLHNVQPIHGTGIFAYMGWLIFMVFM